MAGFLANAISGIKLPEARVAVTVEQDSLDRMAKKILLVVFIILVMAFIYKKATKSNHK